ncbi:MAG: hypothetical protein WBG50_16320 [Desulfomonilaceae bacterium]
MRNKLMAGVWRYILGVPPFLWEKQIQRAVRKVERSTRFMTAQHRQVHHYVAKELPRYGRPMPPDLVARELNLASGRLVEILEDLERHLTFVYRDKEGKVIWAYPVTVEKTPHSLTFHSGEELYAA